MTREELNNQKEINRLKEEELRLQREKNSAQRAAVDLSYSLVESLKETLGIKTKNTEFERDMLKTSREVNKALVERRSNFSSISSLQKTIEKDNQSIKKAQQIQLGLEKSINLGRKNGAGDTVKTFQLIQEQNAALEKQILAGIESGNLKEEDIENLRKQIGDNEALADLQFGELSTLEKQYVISKLQSDELSKQVGIQEDINEGLGVAGGFADLIGKIPGLGGFAKDALSDVTTEMQNMADNGEAVPKGFQAMNMVIGSVGKNLAKSLSDPFVVISAVVGTVVNMLKGADKAIGELAKGMNVSVSEATEMKLQLKDFAKSSDSSFVTSKGMSESLKVISKTLGTNVMLNSQLLDSFTKLRESAGLTNEELMGIAQLSLATGENLDDQVASFAGAVTQASLVNGVVLNQKDLMKEIGNVSAATTLSFSKNPKLIGQAVATAKALGFEMSKVEDIASSLLDFESSIESELEAELLLGRDINLEKARQAALNNDLATVAKEISEQAGSAAEFAEMNRIQQDALAKSVGMSREDLAQTLFVQEQLAGASGDEAKEREKMLNNRIKEVGLEQAQKELAEGSLETMENQASQQERIGAMVAKIQDAFMGIADIILTITEPLVNVLGPVFNGIATAIGFIVKGLNEMKPLLIAGAALLGIMYAKTIGLAIASAARAIFTAVGSIPFIGPVLALAGIAGAVGYIKSVSKPAGDMMSPADGKTQVSTKEGGLFTLSPNDDLIAAPGAANAIGNSGGSSVVVQENKETNDLLKQLISTNQENVKLNKKKPQISPVGLYEVQ